MSQWDKLIDEILKSDKNLRFEDLAKALTRIGYTQGQPKGGSSHYTFRKDGRTPITIPKAVPINKAYIEMVRDAVIEYESEVD
ncbi:MAG: toxin HicA [Clostridiales bacterium]|nr:toxin HicA [Clostridiales bacterium]